MRCVKCNVPCGVALHSGHEGVLCELVLIIVQGKMVAKGSVWQNVLGFPQRVIFRTSCKLERFTVTSTVFVNGGVGVP